jgi:hypothetical protein
MINTRADLDAADAAVRGQVIASLWTASINAVGERSDDAIFGFAWQELDGINGGTPPVPVIQEPPPEPEKTLSRRAVRLGLIHHGLLEAVESALITDAPLRVWYEDTAIFRRNSPMIAQMAAAMGKDAAWLDEFFATDFEGGV